ncbi:unnamed protein product [Rotaria magnacalcarata]
MNGFLSTTKDETVAKRFASEGIPKPNQIAVIFKLNIDPKVIDKPYAEIPLDRHGVGPYEEELLFSIGSVWRINNVIDLQDNTDSIQQTIKSKRT